MPDAPVTLPEGMEKLIRKVRGATPPNPEDRRFPIQGEWDAPNHRRIPACTIPWAVAEVAFAEYARQTTNGQTLERLAERGGFGRYELIQLLAGERL